MAHFPNILFLFTDQQRYDTIGALGNPVIRTPVLDRLAREGVAFNRCYTPSPVCVSARCSLVTGLPPHRTGCVDNQPTCAELPSFMQRLATRGYQTHGVGKMHFVPDPRKLWGFESRDISEEGEGREPWDDYHCFLDEHGATHAQAAHGLRGEYYYIPQPSQLPTSLHHSAWVADRSMDFLKRRDRKRPFFLWSSFIKPHPPFESPDPWHKLYRTPEMAEPLRFAGQEALHTYWNRVQNRYKYCDGGYNDRPARTIRAAYYAAISFIDFQIGRLLDAMGDLVNDTLIVFASDHGELLGDYGCYGKRSMLDAAARVPLIARWPGGVMPRGSRVDQPTSLLDLWPTFLSAAGERESQACEDGVNLADVALSRCGRQTVYSQFQQGGDALYMAATENEKYIYSAPDQRQWYFDLQRDPRETTDLSENPQFIEKTRQIRQSLVSRYQAAGEAGAAAVEGGDWRKYPVRDLPAGRDAGLLFQDAPDLQRRIDALGPYARSVTISNEVAYRLFAQRD
ncbi:MAG: sulfatase family protein [Phycisphaerales bacterium]